jgi:hypothetical protein
MDDWLKDLEGELHECSLPAHPERERGRAYACKCGCVWQVFRTPRYGLHWVLTRDPDRASA